MKFSDTSTTTVSFQDLSKFQAFYREGVEFLKLYGDVEELEDAESWGQAFTISLAKLHNGLEFPIGEWQDTAHATEVLAITMGEYLYRNCKWFWTFINDKRYKVTNFAIIDPSKNFGIVPENLMKQMVFDGENYDFMEIWEDCISGHYAESVRAQAGPEEFGLFPPPSQQ